MPAQDDSAVTTIDRVPLKSAEIGEGLTIRRALPTRQRRMVGAWCFLDHLGPVAFGAGEGMHVGAHPHTCLQTFTWMIQGQILHRDSLGSQQVIRPGQVNLMTAGRGIVHTEDSLPAEPLLHAAQLWIALPPEHADTAPAFEHYPDLPTWSDGGVDFTLLAGHHGGHTAPTRLYSPLLGLDLNSEAGATATLALNPAFEYGLLPLQGRLRIGSETLSTDEFAYLGQGHSRLVLELEAGSRVLLLGGAPFEHPIVMWWNFVDFSREAIAQSQKEWEANAPRFGRVAGDEGRRLLAPALSWKAATGLA
ncbi:MAG TPA: pirin family protein [Macromonas sp.]|nr:pirin family protein [Macromonas sp.]